MYMLRAQYYIITIIISFRSSFITPPSSFYFSHPTVLHAYTYVILLLLLLLYDCAHRSFTRVICCTRLVIVFTPSRIIIIIYLRAPMNYKYTRLYVCILVCLCARIIDVHLHTHTHTIFYTTGVRTRYLYIIIKILYTIVARTICYSPDRRSRGMSNGFRDARNRWRTGVKCERERGWESEWAYTTGMYLYIHFVFPSVTWWERTCDKNRCARFSDSEDTARCIIIIYSYLPRVSGRTCVNVANTRFTKIRHNNIWGTRGRRLGSESQNVLSLYIIR